MVIVDSHAHVSTARFEEDRDGVLARARAAGLVAIMDVGCDLASSQASLAFAHTDPLVWATAGIHPHEAKHWTADSARALAELAEDPRVLAIGEAGLDFHYNHSSPEQQRVAFRAQLELAIELDLPVVLHIREAYDEAFAILDSLAHPNLRGVSHCFTGDAKQAKGFVKRGFLVSFTGVVTFKNADAVKAAARVVPLDRLLIETDAPYMAPVPLRGKRCEPAFVVHTARALASLRGESPAQLCEATSANAARMYGFSLPG